MRNLLDELLVGGVLLASVVYAIFSLGPRALRRSLASWAAAVLRSLPKLPGVRSLAGRLQATSTKPAGACGGCDDCGAATPARGPPGTAEPEVRIPLSKIGKRLARKR